MDSGMQHHLGNISRMVGNDVSKRYSYVVSNDELTNAYIQMRNELGYPLMMDSKYRRAIVYNKTGLEKKITEMINNTIMANIKELEKMVAEDIVNDVLRQINSIKTIGNGTFVKGSSGTSNFASRLGSMLAKSMVKGIGDIIDDMLDTNDKRR